MAGEIKCFVVKESAGVIRFDEEYALSAEEAKTVSDHYPVAFHLERKQTQVILISVLQHASQCIPGYTCL